METAGEETSKTRGGTPPESPLYPHPRSRETLGPGRAGAEGTRRERAQGTPRGLPRGLVARRRRSRSLCPARSGAARVSCASPPARRRSRLGTRTPRAPSRGSRRRASRRDARRRRGPPRSPAWSPPARRTPARGSLARRARAACRATCVCAAPGARGRADPRTTCARRTERRRANAKRTRVCVFGPLDPRARSFLPRRLAPLRDEASHPRGRVALARRRRRAVRPPWRAQDARAGRGVPRVFRLRGVPRAVRRLGARRARYRAGRPRRRRRTPPDPVARAGVVLAHHAVRLPVQPGASARAVEPSRAPARADSLLLDSLRNASFSFAPAKKRVRAKPGPTSSSCRRSTASPRRPTRARRCSARPTELTRTRSRRNRLPRTPLSPTPPPSATERCSRRPPRASPSRRFPTRREWRDADDTTATRTGDDETRKLVHRARVSRQPAAGCEGDDRSMYV